MRNSTKWGEQHDPVDFEATLSQEQIAEADEAIRQQRQRRNMQDAVVDTLREQRLAAGG